MENSPILPTRCCAKCGFLYGLAANPASHGDAVFDPDRIRDNSYPPQFGKSPGLITSLPYVSQECRITVDHNSLKETIELEPIEVRELGWADTVSICCYKNLFPNIYVERKPYQGTQIAYREYVENASPNNRDKILLEIRKDRQDCSGFFMHHFGYSPSQHIQLALEERRTQRQEEHERRLNEWIKYQDEKWERYKIYVAVAALFVSVVTVFVAFATAMIQPLVAHILQLISGAP